MFQNKLAVLGVLRSLHSFQLGDRPRRQCSSCTILDDCSLLTEDPPRGHCHPPILRWPPALLSRAQATARDRAGASSGLYCGLAAPPGPPASPASTAQATAGRRRPPGQAGPRIPSPHWLTPSHKKTISVWRHGAGRPRHAPT